LIVPGQAQHPPPGDVGDDDDEPVGALGRDRRSRIGQFEVAPGAHPLSVQRFGAEVMECVTEVHALVEQQPLHLAQPRREPEDGGEVLEFGEVQFEHLCASLSADSPAALSAPTIAPAEVPAMRWKSYPGAATDRRAPMMPGSFAHPPSRTRTVVAMTAPFPASLSRLWTPACGGGLICRGRAPAAV